MTRRRIAALTASALIALGIGLSAASSGAHDSAYLYHSTQPAAGSQYLYHT